MKKYAQLLVDGLIIPKGDIVDVLESIGDTLRVKDIFGTVCLVFDHQIKVLSFDDIKTIDKTQGLGAWLPSVSTPPLISPPSGNLTQAEIDELFKALEQTQLELWNDSHSPKAACEHEYVEYKGFTDSYHYCKKCDVKKS